MSTLEALLRVQGHDTAMDQLEHRRAHLPERAGLVAAEAQQNRLLVLLVEARTRRGEVLDRQSRIEASITATDERITEIDRRLYSGEITATREILAMTAEVESLKGRRSSLEDELLASMEEDEPVAAEVTVLEEELAALESETRRLGEVIAEAERAIDAEIDGVARDRAAEAEQVPEDLLATYDKLRASLGGVGAARLVGRQCSGCHLTLPAQEVDRLKRAPADTVVLCDQCGRILVR